ncbi:MAG TPA: DUF4249 domain-containing protein [Bacteroidales bacterium]|nr:DUF4249 domain-containing protein [Bacteroidales bacterium]
MKTAVKIFALITLAATCSCTKDVDILRFPEYKRKLVISGFLSPDEETHYISVGMNQVLYVGSDESPYPGKITGSLSDGGKEISLRPIFRKYDIMGAADSIFAGFVFTSAELAVEEGKTYTLKVSDESGLYAESSCTVPQKKNLSPAFDTLRVYSQYDPGYSYLQGEVSFTDIPGEENYYALLCERIHYRAHNTPPRAEFQNLLDPKKSYFNDVGIDGKRTTVRLNIFNSPGNSSDSAFIKIYLLNTDKPYYDFHKSVANYVSGEDPFTEASPIYSNIKGGLGIFAAYTCDSIIVRLK